MRWPARREGWALGAEVHTMTQGGRARPVFPVSTLTPNPAKEPPVPWFATSLVPMVAVLAGVAGGPAHAQPDATDPGTAPAGSVEVLARMEGPGPSGIAVTPEGRVFVGFPRHADDHASATLAELKDGRLVPYPSEAMSLPSDAPPEKRLLSVHGMTTDRLGRLWVIDDGKRKGHDIPEGGAKVVGIDPRTNEVFASVTLKPPVLRPDSHMNDLRVDLGHGAKGTAYVADSSFGTSPALVVVDLASGRQRRVLATHPSTQPDPGFLTMLEGRALTYDAKHPTFPVGGVDGVALGEGGRRLYYSPLSSHRLYSIPTDVLANPAASDVQLAANVRDEGEKGAADGLAEDAQGRLYTTDFEHDAILRRSPDGTFERLAYDPRFIWPDGIFVDARYVYVTLGQWNRLPDFNGGKDRREPPYLLVRIPKEPPPTVRSPAG
ncbi:L-dopachrome tautomerase-related protein [Corallococcus silvisoli]|uniref:L-dopachrome tautomerase-related protein n=1 Tax=Corallococcus silvisoli TaxID=2697031 RepID=UPI002E281B37|nr:L-dopachrome tautomerase-related protein [Corallococcus silvisoli]